MLEFHILNLKDLNMKLSIFVSLFSMVLLPFTAFTKDIENKPITNHSILVMVRTTIMAGHSLIILLMKMLNLLVLKLLIRLILEKWKKM